MLAHKSRRAVAALALAVALGGCASYSGHGLKPGVATADEVRRTMGTPRHIYRDNDGSESWEYSHGPAGLETFMVRLDKNRVLERVEQVLNEQGFARIVVGRSNGDDVLRAIGSPWRTGRFERRKEEFWDYRFQDIWGYNSQFHVIFDEGGIVKQTMAIREFTPSDRPN